MSAALETIVLSWTGHSPRQRGGVAHLRPKTQMRGSFFRTSATTFDSPGIGKNLQLVDDVKSRLARDYPSLPLGKYGRDDEQLLLWFLKDRKYNVEAAVNKLATFMQWRHEFGVDAITEESVQGIASTGKAYVHTSPDFQGRPVLVVVARQHYPVEEEAIASQKLCVYLVERALEQLPPGGEQILGIFDLRGFTTSNADLNFVKFLIDVFYYYYPRRLGQVLFVDAPFIFRPAWSIIKPLLKSYSGLVRFCSATTVRDEYFNEDTAPPDF